MKIRVCIAMVTCLLAPVEGLFGQTAAENIGPVLSGPPYRILSVAHLKAVEGSPGTVLIDEELSYGWTGHVVANVHNKAMFGAIKFKTPALKAGQAVYGLPMQMQGYSGTSLFWCAPVPGKNGWSATCMTPTDKVTYSAFRNGLTVMQFMGNTAQGSEPVSVRTEAVTELPTSLRITHSVTKWHKHHVELTTLVSAEGRPDGKGIVTNIGRGEDGTVRFSVAGGIVRLKERPDGGFTATILRDFVSGGTAMIDYWDR